MGWVAAGSGFLPLCWSTVSHGFMGSWVYVFQFCGQVQLPDLVFCDFLIETVHCVPDARLHQD